MYVYLFVDSAIFSNYSDISDLISAVSQYQVFLAEI